MISYIDMDGVLVDFYLGVHRFMGKKVDGFPYMNGWDWVKEIGSKYKTYPVQFWANLPKNEDADRILGLAEGKIVIATDPSAGLNSLIGKRLWLDKHYPDLPAIFITEKWQLAGFDRTLFDDNENQIKLFEEHGGIGTLIERPWNVHRNCAFYPPTEKDCNTCKVRKYNNGNCII